MTRPLRKTALGSIVLAGALLAVAVTVEAQQTKKTPRIGYLAVRSSPSPFIASNIDSNEQAFLQGLRSLGYIEGQNIVIEWRFARENFDRRSELANELVRLKVDVIVTSGDIRLSKPCRKQPAQFLLSWRM